MIESLENRPFCSGFPPCCRRSPSWAWPVSTHGQLACTTPPSMHHSSNILQNCQHVMYSTCFFEECGESALLSVVVSLLSAVSFLGVACQHTWSASMHHTPINASQQQHLTKLSASAVLCVFFIVVCDNCCVAFSSALSIRLNRSD